MEEAFAEFVILFPGLFFLIFGIYLFYRYFVFSEIYSLIGGIFFGVLFLIDLIWFLKKRELFFRI